MEAYSIYCNGDWYFMVSYQATQGRDFIIREDKLFETYR